MNENQSFALWMIPTGEAYSLTSGYIARLSSLYRLPGFEPHVTVLGGVRSPDGDEMRKLARDVAPFRIRLAREVEYMPETFRCLFLRAYTTDALMEIFSKASATFGVKPDSYFPHLSLAYGDLPVWKKQEMIAELGPVPEIEFEARGLALVQASTETPVSSWKVVEHFSFTEA